MTHHGLEARATSKYGLVQMVGNAFQPYAFAEAQLEDGDYGHSGSAGRHRDCERYA